MARRNNVVSTVKSGVARVKGVGAGSSGRGSTPSKTQMFGGVGRTAKALAYTRRQQRRSGDAPLPRQIDWLAVTGASATDIFTSTAHGYTLDTRVRFRNLTGGAGIAVDTDYYVIAGNLAANTFQVSLTPRGASINFTTDLTAGQVGRHSW